jgi:hypothetical protein
MEDEIDPREEAMWNAHYEAIVKAFGEARARKANIGWGHSEGSVCSKVYGNPIGFLTTEYDSTTFEILEHRKG